MKKKSIAGFFALFFGMLGLHRFYLGQRFLGFLYIIAFSISVIAFAETDIPFFMIVGLVGFMDALLILAMPKEDFHEKFNIGRDESARGFYRNSKRARRKKRREKESEKNSPRAMGLQKFRDFDVEGALGDFKKSLKVDYEDAAVHFNIACCYSFLEEENPAFFHLSKAVQFGFIDFERIDNHDALAFIRTLPRFETFARNGYRYLPEDKQSALPPPQASPLKPLPETKEMDLLEQIKQLGMLRDRGILTDAEFELQKKKIIDYR